MWWKSRTIWFSIILAILGVVDTNLHLFKDLIGPEYYGFVVTGIGAVVAVLRVVTTKPLKER